MIRKHTPIKWPEEVRLKMIERSKFFEDERVYEYGYYDGYQEALARHEKQINNHDRLVEALENIVDAQFNTAKTLATMNAEILIAKQLLTELKA